MYSGLCLPAATFAQLVGLRSYDTVVAVLNLARRGFFSQISDVLQRRGVSTSFIFLNCSRPLVCLVNCAVKPCGTTWRFCDVLRSFASRNLLCRICNDHVGCHMLTMAPEKSRANEGFSRSDSLILRGIDT